MEEKTRRLKKSISTILKQAHGLRTSGSERLDDENWLIRQDQLEFTKKLGSGAAGKVYKVINKIYLYPSILLSVYPSILLYLFEFLCFLYRYNLLRVFTKQGKWPSKY